MPESLWQAVQHESEKRTSPPQEGKRMDTSTASVNKPTTGRPAVPSSQPPEDLTPPRPSERPEHRPVQRRPYDFYVDQILWLKETKLEIEKRYGRTVAANAMVQLALDLLIKDYQRNQERSKLVSILVTNQP